MKAISPVKTIAIIGIGNPVLADDAAGLYAVNQCRRVLAGHGHAIHFTEFYSGGFDLFSELAGYHHVYLFDSMFTGEHPPGTCLHYPTDQLLKSFSITSHSVDIQSLLKIGEALGYAMPPEVTVIGIEGVEKNSFRETLTPAVSEGINRFLIAFQEDVILKLRQAA